MAWHDNDAVKAVLLAAGLFIFWSFSQLFFLLFLSILLAIILSSAIEFTEKVTGFPRLTSAFIAYALILGVLVGVGFLLAPSVSSQYDSFMTTLPSSLDKVQSTFTQLKIPEEVVDPGSYEFFSGVTATNTLSTGVGILLDLIFVFILGFYFAGDPKPYANLFGRVISKKQLKSIQESLRWWLTGRFASMLVVTILTVIGLFSIGLPFALVLALIAGFMSFVPNLGPIISFIPAGVISASIGTDTLLLTAALYGVVQLLETYLITPQIEKQTIDLKPGLGLTVQLIMGTIFGFMGLLLAVPTLIVVRSYFEST